MHRSTRSELHNNPQLARAPGDANRSAPQIALRSFNVSRLERINFRFAHIRKANHSSPPYEGGELTSLRSFAPHTLG